MEASRAGAKVKKLPELCPGWGCCIPAREDRGPAGSFVEGEAAGQPQWSWERSRLAGGGVNDGCGPGRASMAGGDTPASQGACGLGEDAGVDSENWENLGSWE